MAAFRGLPANRYRRDLAGRPIAGRGRRPQGGCTKTVQLMRASTVIVSMVSDSVTNDAEIDSRKPNRPTAEADDQGAEGGGGVAGGEQPGQRPGPRQQYGGEDEPGHRVEQEQRPVGGDVAVALLPQVQMDVPDPGQQRRTAQAQQQCGGPAAGPGPAAGAARRGEPAQPECGVSSHAMSFREGRGLLPGWIM